MVANGIGFQKRFHVFGDDVILEIHRVAGFGGLQISVFKCVRDDSDGKTAAAHSGNGQADAVNSDRALLDDVAGRGSNSFNLQLPTVTRAIETPDLAHAIHVSLDDMTAEP